MQNIITPYIAELNWIYTRGNATEHTYRPALKSLLEKMTKGLTITNEPKRIACGAPDYIVTRKEIPVGYVEAKDNEVEKPQYAGDKVYINDTQYFDNVPLVSWNFYIGGYQPAQKWLKDRKGRTLNYEDIRHY